MILKAHLNRGMKLDFSANQGLLPVNTVVCHFTDSFGGIHYYSNKVPKIHFILTKFSSSFFCSYIWVYRKHGIFHLTDPSGMSVMHDCQETGFHPHEEPLDGNPIYEHCSHVYMNTNVKFELIDLRNL
jgi:hypothetical protein